MSESIAVSCRVRLARNLSEYHFPHILDNAKANEVKKRISECMDRRSYSFIDIQSLPNVDRLLFIERHLISPDLLKQPEKSAVMLKKDQTVSLMINEEDHIRLQCMLDGLRLDEVYALAEGIGKYLESQLKLARDKSLGYLTACPTNLGTGLRASVMLHLPALKHTNKLGGVFSALNKVGLTVRGIYGEGTEALGDMYQLSNRIALGQSEQELISSVTRAAQKTIENETKVRENLLRNDNIAVSDRIYRAYATLRYARILNSNDFMNMISDVKLGLSLGLLKDRSHATIDKLMINVQPAGVMKRMNEEAGAQRRDIKRAEIVRDCITNHIMAKE